MQILNYTYFFFKSSIEEKLDSKTWKFPDYIDQVLQATKFA